MSNNEQLDFGTALKRLEDITARMNMPDVPLEEAMSLYQEGRRLAAWCENRLAGFEAQIGAMDKRDAAGLA